ncbi:MAG: outer membrane beta-barrel protein [Rickettsiales bacterium]|nr:outer membrane beta-barrel protein [Rickettsiales bacterium]
MEEVSYGDKVAIGVSKKYDTIKGSIRAEFEYGFNGKTKFKIESKAQPGEFTDGKLKNSTYFANFYYDSQYSIFGINPYIGFGLGVSNTKNKLSWQSKSNSSIFFKGNQEENNFAYNFGAGLTYTVENIAIDLGYRYQNLGKIDNLVLHTYNTTTPYSIAEYELTAQELYIGARYNF